MKVRHATALAFVMVAMVASSLEAQTHLGVNASNLVTLEATGPGPDDDCELVFKRILPDGTIQQGFFQVPPGQVLVVTDVDWGYAFSTNPGGVAGMLQTLQLYVLNIDNPGEKNYHLLSNITLSDALEGGTTVSLTAGFPVNEHARLCPEVSPGGGFLRGVIVRGYLTRR